MDLQGIVDDIIPATFEPVPNLFFRIIVAIFIVIIGRLLAKMLTNLLHKTLERAHVDETLVPFFSRGAYYILLIVVIVIALGVVGIPTSSIVAILGAATLAIGLALQDSINNLASGISIIMLRPFVVGDFVDLADEEGFVTEIRLFHTLITTRDNKAVFVPNKDVMGGKITNYTLTDLIRLDLIYGISYSDDILKAKRIVEQILAADERIATEPSPTVAVKELGDNSVNLIAWPHVDPADELRVTFAVTEQVKLRFDEAGITIPFPQRDVHLYRPD